MARAPVAQLYYTVRELAEARRCSTQHVRDLIERGEIVAERDGRSYIIPASEYQRLTGAIPGHEGVSSSAAEQVRREAVRDLRRWLAEGAKLLADLEG